MRIIGLAVMFFKNSAKLSAIIVLPDASLPHITTKNGDWGFEAKIASLRVLYISFWLSVMIIMIAYLRRRLAVGY